MYSKEVGIVQDDKRIASKDGEVEITRSGSGRFGIGRVGGKKVAPTNETVDAVADIRAEAGRMAHRYQARLAAQVRVINRLLQDGSYDGTIAGLIDEIEALEIRLDALRVERDALKARLDG